MIKDCPSCAAMKAAFEAVQASTSSELAYLRQMVKDLTDKLMCMSPDLADRHHRLELTKLAQTKPEVLNGIVPLGQTIPSEDDGMEQWLDSFQKIGGVNGKG